ncbi:MAG: VOC family protein [Sphingomonas sp.]|nr:VOC family protein [Sphingomonas sp.]
MVASSRIDDRSVHGRTQRWALQSSNISRPTDDVGTRFEKGVPFNHVGVQVDDLDAVEARVLAQGLTPFAHDDYEPGRRFYFFDPDGIEYEIVSYTPPQA